VTDLAVRSLCVHHLGPLDLSVESGECLALVGDSGAGKSLLLRAIVDLEIHDGEVLLDGRSYEDFPPEQWRRCVGLLPAETHWWYDRVGQHFSQPDLVELSALGLGADVLNRPVTHLSNGESQRLALLRLLANRPRVLLLDEPTASLDETNARRVEDLVRNYCRAHEAALIWVSHDRFQLQRLGARKIYLREGQLGGQAT
jgi:putative ABC transport system ATP-binding protein